MSNTNRENANIIFTSDKLDKTEELVDAVNILTINYAEYYESNTATASDAQGDLTHNQEIVTQTSNGNFEQKILRNLTIPVLPPTMNPGIDQGIVLIILSPHTILTPATKELVANVAS